MGCRFCCTDEMCLSFKFCGDFCGAVGALFAVLPLDWMEFSLFCFLRLGWGKIAESNSGLEEVEESESVCYLLTWAGSGARGFFCITSVGRVDFRGRKLASWGVSDRFMWASVSVSGSNSISAGLEKSPTDIKIRCERFSCCRRKEEGNRNSTALFCTYTWRCMPITCEKRSSIGLILKREMAKVNWSWSSERRYFSKTEFGIVGETLENTTQVETGLSLLTVTNFSLMKNPVCFLTKVSAISLFAK